MENNKRVHIGAKTVVMILAVALIVCSAIGGTIAWLIAQTEPVVNTFTYGDINIDLDETGMVENPEGGYIKEFEMIPGKDLVKDPKVTVKAGSEACWLFVKLEENGGNVTVDGKEYTFDDFLSYEVAEGWIQYTDAEGNAVEGVYYREVEVLEAGTDAVYQVLKDDKVTVSSDVTKEMLNELGDDDYPTLTITAYAVQKANIATVQEAWALANGEETP